MRRARLVTLTGPGGIGKTHLAVALAYEIVEEFAQGVILVSLESLSPARDSGAEGQRSIVQQIAAARGVKEGAGRSLLAAVTESLGRQRLLLVLDNCEHVLEPCAGVITHLLRECLGLRILATSREALHVSGEAVWAVPALSVPDPEHLPKGGAARARAMAGYDAVRLFAERAEAAHKRFALNGDNARDVALICSRLDGVPLALELAAARSGVLTPAQILGQLDARPLDALASRLRDIPPRHRTLRATLEWSYGLLAPEAQSFLADMSVFQGGWTLEAAQAVRPDADALEMLTLLRDASLINISETKESVRFSMLETVRQFTHETLEKSGRADAVQQRRSLHYAVWLERQFNGWKEKRGREAHGFFALVEREYPNIKAALTWAREVAEEDLLLHFGLPLVVFWAHTGRIQEGRNWLEIVPPLTQAEEAEEAEEADGLRDGSESAARKARHDRYRAIQDQFLFAIGDYETAAAHSLQNFENALRAGNPVSGRTYLFNAALLIMPSDLKRSLAILEQCLPLEREYSADNRANPVILSQLALVSRLAGQRGAAAHFLSEALSVCRGNEESDPHGYVRGIWVAGEAARAEGDFSLAWERFDATLVVAQRLGDFAMATNALCSLAAIARETGDPERGMALVIKASEAAGPEPPFRQIQMLRWQRIESLHANGDHAGAEALTREGLTVFRGKALSFRLYVCPLSLLLTEMEFAGGEGAGYRERAVRLLGAAGAVAARLGLLAPDRAERERAERLRATLTEGLGPERFAIEEAAGAALDDEAALEFALTQP